ncbi:MAG: protein kinase [Gammaproteobacteria bacterium]|nr:protein kinase [Gammaproteobacteria bacterium]
MAETNSIRNTLPLGFKLLWYEIVALLGQGSFGVTYLAFDTNLQLKVAIKEYMPLEFAARDHADSTIHPLTSKQEEIYSWGLDRFMAEAQTLARFKHPNIVKVYTVFEENNTAYMVMEYEQGEELSQSFKRGELTSESELLEIILPLLEGLELMHTAHVIHRDIKPANIYIREDRTPVLIDFGSARQALGNKTRALTSLVTPGFAPYEQYYESEEYQGPWSDIYALGATTYRAITGHPPTDALVRGRSLLVNTQDQLTAAVVAGAGRYSSHFLAAIDQALMFKESDRPQSAKEFRQMLLGEIAVTRHVDAEGKEQKDRSPQLSPTEEPISIQPTRIQRPQHTTTSSRPKILLIAGIILGVIAVASAGIYTYLNPDILREVIQKLGTQESKKENTLVTQAYESIGKVDWRITIENFQEALAINPESQPAKQGITRLAKYQVAVAEKAFAEGDIPMAKEHLQIASSIIPSMREATKLEKKIVELEGKRRLEKAEKQRQAEIERKRAEAMKLQQSIDYAKARLDKAKTGADQLEAKTRATTAYFSTENLVAKAAELILMGEQLNKEQYYDEAKNALNHALRVIAQAIEGYTNARNEANRQIQKEARIDRQRVEVNTLEVALKRARRKLRKIMTKIDSNKATTYAQQPYRSAQQLSLQAEDMASKALSHKESTNYDEAIAAFKGAITLFNRASRGFENADTLAKEKIAEISKPKPLTEKDIDYVKTRLMEFKQAYEQQDLEKLRRISTMSATQLNILRMIFREYRALEVSISNFAIISNKNSAAATVTITKLETQSGDQVIPSGHWREAKITLYKKGNEWGKINW